MIILIDFYLIIYIFNNFKITNLKEVNRKIFKFISII
jgi:hypothetical protein